MEMTVDGIPFEDYSPDAQNDILIAFCQAQQISVRSVLADLVETYGEITESSVCSVCGDMNLTYEIGT